MGAEQGKYLLMIELEEISLLSDEDFKHYIVYAQQLSIFLKSMCHEIFLIEDHPTPLVP